MMDVRKVRLTWSQAFLLDFGSVGSPLAGTGKNHSRTFISSVWLRQGVQMIWSRSVIAVHARVKLLGELQPGRICRKLVA